ncbi:MAG: flavin reductase family protein [Chloroflexota bacterium]|nr:flavin reductase family protein [Chloroflexota bacterium]
MAKVARDPTTALYPLPAVLVSCGIGPRANIITLAWVGTLCSDPPTIGIGVRPSRYSHGLIEEVGEFVVNLPTADQVEWVDTCGVVSGRDEDKWAACGFTRGAGVEVDVPLIAECPVNIECRLERTLSLGSHDLFIGRIVAVHAGEGLLDDRGRLHIGKADLFAYVGGDYRRVGELLGRHGFSRPS